MYLDLGFSNMVIQIVIAAIVAAAVCLFVFRDRIKNYFAKKKGDSGSDQKNGKS